MLIIIARRMPEVSVPLFASPVPPVRVEMKNIFSYVPPTPSDPCGPAVVPS